MKTPDYLSYDRYKKKKNDTSKKGVLLAVTTFFATLLVFTVIAKILSPDVDVTIGEDSATETKETGLGVKRFIDERLKMIQMEDNSSGASKKDELKEAQYNDKAFDNYSKELEEKVVVPKDNQSDDAIIEEEPIQVKTPPRPSSKELSTPFEVPKVSKVFVGRYSNIEQAKVAQEILLDSGLDITPFVKNMGSYYTLQVGSFSSRAKAQTLVNELQQNSFPARIISE